MVKLAEDRNPVLGYNTLLFRLIPGYLYSAWCHGFLQVRLHCRFLPLCLRTKQGGSFYHFYDGLWYDTGQGANQWPTAWEADTLTTKPSWCGPLSLLDCWILGRGSVKLIPRLLSVKLVGCFRRVKRWYVNSFVHVFTYLLSENRNVLYFLQKNQNPTCLVPLQITVKYSSFSSSSLYLIMSSHIHV